MLNLHLQLHLARCKRLQLLRVDYTVIRNQTRMLIERRKFFFQAVTTCAIVVYLLSLLSERPP